MEWPKHINIIDDSEVAFKLEEMFQDLSWVTDPRGFLESHDYLFEDDDFSQLKSLLEILPHQAMDLIKKNPDYFKNLTRLVRVSSAADISEAVSKLNESGSSVSFIDFDYSLSTPEAYSTIQSLYKTKCPDKWKLTLAPSQMGGCYFASVFEPAPEYPTRLLCPTTFLPPNEMDMVKATRGAITKPVPLQGGGTYMMKAVVLALIRWTEIQNICPLDEIWDKTERAQWFSKENLALPKGSNGDYYFNTYNMSHNLPLKFDFGSHRQTINDVFDLILPEEWWRDIDSIMLIHESLKHLCGVDYCGTPTRTNKYNLCVGSAYFIALLALRDASMIRDTTKLTKGIESFKECRCITSNILPRQDARTAKEGARALYFILKNLFTEDPKFIREDGTLPTVEKAGFMQKGQGLAIEFSGWNASGLAKQISTLLDDPLGTANSIIKEQGAEEAKKLKPSLFNFWRNMVTNPKGFGSPGAIWMERNTLYIYAAQSRPI